MSDLKEQPITKYEVQVIVHDVGTITMCLEDILRAEEQAAFVAINGFKHRRAEDGAIIYFPVHRIHEVIVKEV